MLRTDSGKQIDTQTDISRTPRIVNAAKISFKRPFLSPLRTFPLLFFYNSEESSFVRGWKVSLLWVGGDLTRLERKGKIKFLSILIPCREALDDTKDELPSQFSFGQMLNRCKIIIPFWSWRLQGLLPQSLLSYSCVGVIWHMYQFSVFEAKEETEIQIQ